MSGNRRRKHSPSRKRNLTSPSAGEAEGSARPRAADRAISRRRWLRIAAGGASSGALAVAVTSSPSSAGPPLSSGSLSLPPIGRACGRSGLPVGQIFNDLLRSRSTTELIVSQGSPNWARFIHALDTSNWIEASFALTDRELDSLQGAVRPSAAGASVLDGIALIRRAWSYLHAITWNGLASTR